MSNKYIRFNYFQVRIECRDQNGDYHSAPWDMMELLNYLSVKRNQLNCVVNVGEYDAEFDRDTFIDHMRPEVYSFQVTKLRDNNIPYIKAIGIEREALELNENQYLGEYITVVYDPQYCTVGVQSNLFSLNINQLEVFLTEIRKRFKSQIGEEEEIEYNIKLNPIIDPQKVNNIREAEVFRKITIKGTPFAAEAFTESRTLNRVSEILGDIEGATFEISVSVGQASKDKTLNHETIQEIIDGFNRLDIGDDSKPKIEIKAREYAEDELETVNLLTPRVTNRISLNVENRQAISHEIIHTEFMEKYSEIRNIIARVVAVQR